MGFSREREELMKPMKKPASSAQPTCNSTKPKTNPNWDRLDKLGEGENPLSEKNENREYFRLALYLSIGGFVVATILERNGFPLRTRFGQQTPFGVALYPWIGYILYRMTRR